MYETSSYPPVFWRLIHSEALDGATNMAIDESVLHAVADGQAQPTLRFFAWDPPCLSLGRAQSASDADLSRLQSQGWGLVRRPTGGRAILHRDELTYSIAAPMNDPRVAGSIVESYRRLSAGLLAGLNQLGLSAESNSSHSGQSLGGPVCFEEVSEYEITVGKQKLLGSAQLRKRGVVLQHGTLPISGDTTLICEVLAFANSSARQSARARMLDRAASLTSVGINNVCWQDVAKAMATGIAEALNLTLQPGGLSEAEQIMAKKLRAEKYANESWTLRR